MKAYSQNGRNRRDSRISTLIPLGENRLLPYRA
jgi:hypothetical protein